MRPSSSQTGPRRSNGIRPPTRPLPSMAAPAGSPQTVGRSPSKPQIPSTPQQTPNPIIPKADSGSSEEESSSDESETHSMAQAPKATPVPVPSVSESAHPNVLTNVWLPLFRCPHDRDEITDNSMPQNEEETGSESDEDSDGEDEDKGTRLTPATESLKAPVIPNGLPLVATSKVRLLLWMLTAYRKQLTYCRSKVSRSLNLKVKKHNPMMTSRRLL